MINRVKEMLDEIADEALKIGINLRHQLHPPISASALMDVTKNLPYSLPLEIQTLYRWHDGAWPEGQECEVRILPMFLYPPAGIACAIRVELLKQATESSGPPLWKEEWYPLFTDLAGGYLILNMKQNEFASGRIIRTMEAFHPFEAFWSFESMIESVLECYKAGAYFLDEYGFLEDDVERSADIYRALNKGLCPNK